MEEKKVCSICAIEKDLGEFRSRKRQLKSGEGLYYEPYCIECSKERNRVSSKARRANPEYRKAEYASYKQKCIEDPRVGMLERAKKRAARDGLPFNIVLSDIEMVDTCPLLGLEMAVNYGYEDNHNSYSLDRIDCAKGYTKGNIIVMSRKANAMKGDATADELRLFCKNILKLIGD